MKARLRLLFLMSLMTITISIRAQLREETVRELYRCEDKNNPTIIEPGRYFERTVTLEKKDYPVHRYLRIAGFVKIPGRYAPRGEELFRQTEFFIDDRLDSINTFRDRYSLFFSGENDPFERCVYNRISGTLLRKGKLTMETAVNRNRLQLASGGKFGIELQIYFKKEGRYPDDVYDAPDTVMYLPIPPGNGKFRLIRQTFDLPDGVACILLKAGGTHFTGECRVEAPRIYSGDKPVFAMPFVPNAARQNDYDYWVGVNMTTRCWPKWKLEFNGKTVFEERVFDRASNVADFYVPLPDESEGTGSLKLTLVKEPGLAVFPYQLNSIQLTEESARDFEIVSVPRFVTKGDTSGILMEINKAGITLNIGGGSAVNFPQNVVTFDQPGLHAIEFVARESDTKVPIEISDGKRIAKATIGQIIVKEKDNVFLSVGDDIYIDKEYASFDRYLKWYFGEHVGNLYQFRPSYQWSGVRITDEKFVKHYTALFDRLHVPYAWQVEGRTLAGAHINPSFESLQGPMFRGKQAHENDGGYYYWQHFHYVGLYSDMASRAVPYGGIFAKHRPIYTDHGIFIRYDPYGVKDLADGANKFVANLSYSRGESTRHTGPSVMFRYLYQAGYDWLGAEQMYGPEDIIMSALRGASRAYEKTEYGSLHAMQWGSFPYTDPKHALRFYLSLAVAYIHGSSHINTEDGLWTDEYGNDRYSVAGKQHLYAQHRMFDYIRTHSRKGELYAPAAVIQGKNDAWKAFVRSSLWSQKDGKWAFGKAEESFDLLKVFYPECTVNACGPDGWFTSTPYGAVDILPAEASEKVMNRYKALIFLGRNTFDNADFIRIKKFTERGGTLLLTAAHLNIELQPDAPVRFPEDDTVIKMLLGSDYKNLKDKTVISSGKGTIIYYPQQCYPADEAIRTDYEKSMREIASRITEKESDKGWIKASPYIDFTVWDGPSERTIYVLNTNWKSDQSSQPATLLLGNYEFTFDAARYTITTIRCSNNLAVMPEGNTSDVTNISEKSGKRIITCQTTEADTFRIFDGRTGRRDSVTFSTAGIHRIVWDK